jgi:hypothetical protein
MLRKLEGLTLPRTVFMVSMYWLRPMPSRRTPGDPTRNRKK